MARIAVTDRLEDGVAADGTLATSLKLMVMLEGTTTTG